MVQSQRVNSWVTVGALLLGSFGLTACASKKYVGEEVGKSSAATEKRINDVESQVEATPTIPEVLVLTPSMGFDPVSTSSTYTPGARYSGIDFSFGGRF